MTDRKFMDMVIKGDYNHGRNYLNQRPIEELTPYFKNAFEKGVKAISWNQYTPYFNDGDPCEFGIGDISFTKNPKVVEAWIGEEYLYQEDDSYYDDEGNELPMDEVLRTDFYSYETPWSTDYPHPDGFTKGEIEFPYMAEFEQVLNETFGDHTRVIVTPDVVVQFEYEHE